LSSRMKSSAADGHHDCYQWSLSHHISVLSGCQLMFVCRVL